MSDSTSGGPADPNDPFADKPYVRPTWASDNESTPASHDEAPVDRPESETDAPTERANEAPTERADDAPTEQITHRYRPTGESQAGDTATGAAAAGGASTAGATASETSPRLPNDEHGNESTQQLPYGTRDEGVETAPRQKKKGRGKLGLAIGVLLLGLIGGIGGAAGYEALSDNGNNGAISSLDNASNEDNTPAGAIEKVAQSVLPSVVQINVKGGGEKGSGTGIIISEDGQILTNNHVVEAAADGGTITVSFNDSSIEPAKILGRDPLTDLAVIKADKTGLTPATLGSSADLKVGQEVVAIGSPFGLESTVTSGIVSALNRPVSSSDGTKGGPSTVFPAIQTDAAINPGNSGGPLVNLNGEVVGINSAIRSNQNIAGQSGSIGLGFAIPVDLAKTVAKSLVKGEKVEHSRIGITVGSAVTADGITSTGAQVKDVNDGSAGDKAGLKKGDVITGLNGRAIGSADALVAGIRAYTPGETVKLTVQRGDQKETIEVTLDSDGGELSQ